MKFQMLGDANHAGPVRLSDVYNSQVGDASTGIAASQKALYDAYSSLNSRSLHQVTLGAFSNANIDQGGYILRGNLVCVSVHINMYSGSAPSPIITGLPNGRTSNQPLIVTTYFSHITGVGRISGGGLHLNNISISSTSRQDIWIWGNYFT